MAHRGWLSATHLPRLMSLWCLAWTNRLSFPTTIPWCPFEKSSILESLKNSLKTPNTAKIVMRVKVQSRTIIYKSRRFTSKQAEEPESLATQTPQAVESLWNKQSWLLAKKSAVYHDDLKNWVKSMYCSAHYLMHLIHPPL